MKTLFLILLIEIGGTHSGAIQVAEYTAPIGNAVLCEDAGKQAATKMQDIFGFMLNAEITHECRAEPLPEGNYLNWLGE